MLGWGRLTFWSPDDGQLIALALKYEIDSTGFTFTRLDNSTQRDTNSVQSLAEVLSNLTTASSIGQYQASTILSALPASPEDAFYGPTPTEQEPTRPELSFTFSENQLELQIKTPEALKEQPFAASPHNKTYFKNLQLTITQTLNSPNISVVGSVVAVVLEESIELTAELNAQHQLIFTRTYPDKTLTVMIQGWGEMDINSVLLKSIVPNIEGLQARYTFDEGRGDRIYDCAASNEPIDLTVKTAMPETVAWEKIGNLTLKQVLETSDKKKEEQKVLKAPLLSSDDVPRLDKSSASRLIEACTNTEEITIAAWIKPEQASQGGPARIVALSKSTGERHFMLGQGIGSDPGEESTQYRVRFKTSENEHRNGDLYTEDGDLFLSDLGTATTDLTYVVFTRSKDEESSTENAHLYINGVSNVGIRVEGELKDNKGRSIWDDDSQYKLVMGNVASFEQKNNRVNNNRAWVGQLHRIEIYNRALSTQEIYQQYYPTLEASGQFRLHNGPAPLNTPLPATLTLEQGGENSLELRVHEEVQRTLTPQFHFTSIDGVWRQTLTDAPETEDNFRLVSGQINSLLWGNAIAFRLTGESKGQSGKFRLLAPLESAQNSDSELDLKLEGLNTLTFASITVESLEPSEATLPWQMQSTTNMQEVLLPRLRDGRLFDWTVDFKLLNPALAIENGKVVLKGTWLDQPLALYGWRREGQLIMQGESNFSLPFQITLGPIFEPGTSHRILERVEISSVMETTLTLKLTKLGFLAQVSGTFEWSDQAGTVHKFTIPSFTQSRPPLTPNQILEAVLERLRAQADVIFANQYRHKTDYYFTLVENKPLIYLGKSNSGEIPAQTTALPQLFSNAAGANSISSTEGIFVLAENADQSCTLTITPQEINPTNLNTLKIDYNDFISKLDSNQNLIKGVLTLVKTRIAERIPLLVDDSLYYYYGLDKTNRAVDLQAGMRLRVDYQNYQFVHPAQSTANSGFVGSGTSYYCLNNYRAGNEPTSDLIINFDGFLSQIQPYVNTEINQVGAASSLDIFQVGYQKPYFRLVYPSQTNPSTGSLEPGKAATIIGATSLKDLDNQTNAVSFYFRGRATVIPEIAVIQQGQPVFVPVGTTLRQLLEQTISLPSALPGQSLLHSTGKPRLSRLLHEGVSNEPSYRFINLEEKIPIVDLPLLKGDRITL